MISPRNIVVSLCALLTLTACGGQRETLTPGDLAAKQASYLEFTKSQCAGVLGGDGVKDLTVASVKLQKRAKDLGVVRDYSSPDVGIATGWSISVGMQGRVQTCNDFVTQSYQIMSNTNTI